MDDKEELEVTFGPCCFCGVSIEKPPRRRGAAVAVLLNAAIAVIIGVSLQGACERQRDFKLSSSHEQQVQWGDVDSKRSWAVAYFKRNPDADPLQMIGDYNASGLGKRLGYFSLDEARAIAAEVARSQPRDR